MEKNLDTFFTDAVNSMENKEALYMSLIMNAEGPEAQKARDEYYSRAFKKCGKGLYVGPGVRIVNPQYIEVGDHVSIDAGVTLMARGPGGITLGNHVSLTQRVYLDTEDPGEGYIKIGNGVYVGTGTSLFGHCGLEIGDSSLLAQNISLTPYSHIFEDPNREIIAQGGHTRKVTIGRDVYIGMNSTILYSADIGDGCVVGSGTVVVKPLPPFSVAVGNPARVIRRRGEAKK